MIKLCPACLRRAERYVNMDMDEKESLRIEDGWQISRCTFKCPVCGSVEVSDEAEKLR